MRDLAVPTHDHPVAGAAFASESPGPAGTAERAAVGRSAAPEAALEEQLAASGFVRIHRSRLVNRHHVRSISGNDSGDFTVTLDDGRQIGGSRRWRDALTGSVAAN